MRRSYTIKKSELISNIYIFLLCVYAAATVLASSNITHIFFIKKSSVYTFVGQWIAPLLFILFLYAGKLKKSKLVLMSALSILVFAITIKSQNRGFSIMYAAMLAYPINLQAKKVSKWICRTIMLASLTVLFLFICGLIPGDINLRGTITRYSCGFSSPNAFGNTVLIWMILYIYTKFEKWNWKKFILCLVIACTTYKITNSRMSLLIELFLILMICIWVIKKGHIKNGLYNFASIIYSVATLLCLVLTIVYSKGIFYRQLSVLNVFMSYRLGFMRNYYQNYGIKLFGQGIVTVSRTQQLATGEAWSGIDNSYMYIMICWGFVISIVFCILYFKVGQYLKRKGDYIGAVVIIALCIVGLTESYLSNIAYNFAAILIAEMLSTSLRKKKREAIYEPRFNSNN